MHFIDEFGCQVGITRDYARSPKGTRAVNYNLPRAKRINTIGSLTIDGLSSVMTVDGNVDGDVFECYIENFLSKTLKPNDVVIMDNLSVHNTAKVTDKIEDTGAKILFLPPYSPDLNPIENCWSKVKGILKGLKSKTVQELENNIVKAIDKISLKNAQAWIAHCGYAL